MCVGLCARCLIVKRLTKHHIFPKRFFGSNPGSPILHLCRDCHNDIEVHIPQHTELERDEYLAIAVEFLKGELAA